MARALATFSGKFGDILWSLATAKVLSESFVGERIDFAMMPAYKSLIPLIQAQPYIDKAFVINDWLCVNSNHGDQPWNPPSYVEKKYERFWHLTYKGHPGINATDLPLIDFIADQQGIKLREPLPFIVKYGETAEKKFWGILKDMSPLPRVAYAFNNQYAAQKEKFLAALKERLGNEFLLLDVSQFSWYEAAGYIKESMAFVGCRSANYVMAHGLKQRIICFEPHPARHAHGHLGKIFGCPYGTEVTLPFAAPETIQADFAAATLKNWLIEEKVKEKQYEVNPTYAG